jgi:hypothetical protein
MRKIHLDEQIYQYRVGKGYVVITFPNGHREVVSDSTITGRTPDTLERGRWKKTTDGMVLPSHVKAWLKQRNRIVGIYEMTKNGKKVLRYKRRPARAKAETA